MEGTSHADLCVKSKVKELIKTAEMNCAGDVFDALGGLVGWHVDQAIKRAKANGRKTVKGSDILILDGTDCK